MGTYMDFAKILEKKIRREIEQELAQAPLRTSNSTSPQTEIQSELWTHLVGQLDTRRFEAPVKGQAYHRQRPAPRPRPAHQLNAEQTEAMEFFAASGQALAANFNSADLKKAFRQMALKLHPDQGGTAITFQRLLKARRSLESLFKQN
jgi:hypothetical protein